MYFVAAFFVADVSGNDVVLFSIFLYLSYIKNLALSQQIVDLSLRNRLPLFGSLIFNPHRSIAIFALPLLSDTTHLLPASLFSITRLSSAILVRSEQSELHYI